MSLTFDADTHEYRWNGVRMLSVTQAIKGAGLIDTDWYTDFARQRGKAVHEATHYLDENDLEINSVSPVVKPFLDAYETFKSDMSFVPERIEERVCVPQFGYAGTLDRIGQLKGETVLLDIKTGEIRPWVRLQTAAYGNAVKGGAALRRFGLQLKPNSKPPYKILAHRPAEFHRDFQDFLSCIRNCQLREEMGLCLPQ